MHLLQYRYWLPICCLLLVLFCTIRDNNGNPAVPEEQISGFDTTTLSGTPSVFITPDSAYVFPGDTLGILVRVFIDSSENDSLQPLSLFRITASANRGTIIDDTLVTNNDGRARFLFTDESSGNVEFTVSVGEVAQTARFTVTTTPVKVQKLLQMVPGSSFLKADGIDTTSIAVSVLNSFRNPIVDECVQFITTAGSIAGMDNTCNNSGQSKTGADGVARALLTSSNINDTAYITAYLVSDQSLSDEVEVSFNGMTISVTSSKNNLKTGDTAVITATVLNASGNAVGKTPVYFSTEQDDASPLEIITADSTTNYEGVATLYIRAESNGSDEIIISSAGARENILINVSSLSLDLEIDKTILQTTSQDTSFVTATFTNASGNGLGNRTIRINRTFKTDNGSDTSDVLSAKTNSSGNAIFPIPALLWEGKMRLNVIGYDNTEGYASADTLLQFITTRVMTIRPPQPIMADGSSKGTVQVFIKNKRGNPVVGDYIAFSTTSGTITAQSKTDSTGKAEASLISDRRNIIATVTATLVSDPTKQQATTVEFKGIELTALANPPSIRSNGTDSTLVIISLQDAAKIPIVGERINISRQHTTTTLRLADSVTDNNGELFCTVSGTGSGSDTLTVSSAGATANVVVNYSSNILLISPADNQAFLADSTDSTGINISYLKGDMKTPIGNASLEIAATVGSMDTIFARKFTTDANGKASFYLRNPHFAVMATITGIAQTSDEMTTGNLRIYFKANVVKYIQLSGSPEVISTNEGRAKIEAIALDSNKNRIKDARISFNIVNGPSGGEYLDPPIATTGDDGKASTYLVSGKTPSEYQEVWITAGSFTSVKSDTVRFTISGPPQHINIATNIEKGIDPKDGTFILPCAAIVTDVNGNPVADGTEVTFSLQISGYVTRKSVVHFTTSGIDSTYHCYYSIDTVYQILNFEDFNNNFRLDPGEDRNHDGLLNRGENINGDQNSVTGKDNWIVSESFNDINGDGIRQYNRWIPVEPLYMCGNQLIHAELNFNNVWDPIEPLDNFQYMRLYERLLGRNAFWNERVSPGSLSAQDLADFAALDSLDSLYALVPYDIDYNGNGVCDPNTAVSITRTVTTVNGKALNQIIYGQSDATNIQVFIKAESKGVITESPEMFILPIIQSED